MRVAVSAPAPGSAPTIRPRRPAGLSVLDAANRAVRAIVASPRPVVAVVQGPAAGVGASLALACDVVLASEKGYFMLAFTKIGLMPDGGASALVAAAVGRIRAMRMALLAERIPAAEALQAGLVTAVYPADDLDAEVDKVVATLVRGPVVALAKTKEAVNATTLTELDAALEREHAGQASLLRGTDYREGIRAFQERRAANFTDSCRIAPLLSSRRACAVGPAKIVGRGRTRSATIERVSTQFDLETPAHTGGWRVLAPFRSREYRLLITAVSFSIFAEGMWAVVMALQVIGHRQRPCFAVAGRACLGVGLSRSSWSAGIAADRFPQRTIIIVVETVNFVGVSAVARSGTDRLAADLAHGRCRGGVGIAAAFFFPAYSAILPRILPAEQLLAANGIEGVVRPVLQRAIGPAFAGMLVGATFPALGLGRGRGDLRRSDCSLLVATRPVTQPFFDDERRSRSHTCCATCGTASCSCCAPRGCWTLLFASMFVLVVLGPDRGAAAVHRHRPVRRRRADIRLRPGGLRDGQSAGRAGRVVGTAAAALPDGDDGSAGVWATSAVGGRSASRRRSR